MSKKIQALLFGILISVWVFGAFVLMLILGAALTQAMESFFGHQIDPAAGSLVIISCFFAGIVAMMWWNERE